MCGGTQNKSGGAPFQWQKLSAKQPVVNEIKELLTDAQSAVLVSYRGITVEQDTAMRKELREADVEYKNI